AGLRATHAIVVGIVDDDARAAAHALGLRHVEPDDVPGDDVVVALDVDAALGVAGDEGVRDRVVAARRAPDEDADLIAESRRPCGIGADPTAGDRVAAGRRAETDARARRVEDHAFDGA